MPKPLRPYFATRGIELYHGDSFEILPRLRRKFDLLLTDPPYAIKNVGGGGFKAKIYDDPRFRELCSFDPVPFLDAAAAAQPGALNLVATCSRDLVPLYARMALERRWGFDLHVWHKPNAVPFTHNTFKSDLEYIVLLYQSRRPFNNGFPQSTYSKLFTHSTMRTKVHPTQKPRDLMKKYAHILCPTGGRILDLYAGSATTLVAAMQLGLKAVGIERDKTYCERAAERLRKGE
jgi:site-specific DNA-methyltransferase (adenine-specific)